MDDADAQGLHAGALVEAVKTLSERIDDYMVRKQLDRQTAIDNLLTFALDVLDGRRKGGSATGNRPQQEKHLARVRKVRQK